MLSTTPGVIDLDLNAALATAREAVQVASSAALRYFRQPLIVEYKTDKSPVTHADTEAENAILQIIRRDFPDHSILTEETGSYPGSSRSRWIIDPIDGTRGFARGGEFWGPLVALEHDGMIVAGAIALPALQRTYWAARGLGAFTEARKLSVSTTSEWNNAILSIGEMRTFLRTPALRDSLINLTLEAAQARCFGDLAACMMLLEGRADAWIETGVKPWDIAALKILVEEAGGRFTDFSGNPTIENGKAVATNGLLHAHVLAKLSLAGSH